MSHSRTLPSGSSLRSSSSPKVTLRFRVDPSYLRQRTHVPKAVHLRITKPNSALIRQLLGESGRRMARDGATFHVQQDLALTLIKARVATKAYGA